MKTIFKTLLLSLFLTVQPSSASEQAHTLVIVANTDNEFINLTRRDVRNLFMGGVLKHDLQAVILPPDSQARILFNTKVVGLTEARIQSYWAQMRFSGRKKQPKQISTESQMIEYLKNNKGAIAYLPASSSIPKELTVLLKVK